MSPLSEGGWPASWNLEENNPGITKHLNRKRRASYDRTGVWVSAREKEEGHY